MENIEPNNELISSLLSLNCITLRESQLIERRRFIRNKNDKLLNFMKPFDEKRFSNFIRCLRQTNQKTVARIIENGGDVIKIKRKTRGENFAAAQLHQNIADLRSRTKPWSERTDKLIGQLRGEGMDILNSHLDGQTMVVWIWCHSQAALDRSYDSNHLKTIVVCEIFPNLTQRIESRSNDRKLVRGVTKLRNEIYILYASISDDPDPSVIRVFEDRNSFRFRNEIDIREIKESWDIGSSEEDNCLYVSDPEGKCVWKITRETYDEYKINKWLSTDYHPWTLSVSSDGQLLMFDRSSSILKIYGSDAELIRSIQLPNDIKDPKHAVMTSIGNFIISHLWKREKRVRPELGNESSARKGIMEEENVKKKNETQFNEKGRKGKRKDDNYTMEKEENEEGESDWLRETGGESESSRYELKVVSELTSDGKMVVRRFIPSNEEHELHSLLYLSLDSDDQVFVADHDRVHLLDSDLRWNRTLLPAEGEDEAAKICYPRRLYFDAGNQQLIVGGLLEKGHGVHVITLVRNLTHFARGSVL